MEVMLMLHRNLQTMLIAETEHSADRKTLLCEKMMTISWAHDKQGNARLVFALFPPYSSALLMDHAAQATEIRMDELFCVYREGELSEALLRDYGVMKQKLYGEIAIVGAMPRELKGRA